MQDFHYFSRKPGELDVRESNDGRGRHGESRKLRESGRSWNFVLSVQNLSLPLQIFSGENVSYKYFADDSFVLQYWGATKIAGENYVVSVWEDLTSMMMIRTTLSVCVLCVQMWRFTLLEPDTTTAQSRSLPTRVLCFGPRNVSGEPLPWQPLRHRTQPTPTYCIWLLQLAPRLAEISMLSTVYWFTSSVCLRHEPTIILACNTCANFYARIHA